MGFYHFVITREHSWRSGLTLASHLCDLGLIPVLAASRGLSLLLVLTLLQGFLSRSYGFPPSTKEINTSKFQFDLDVNQGHKFISLWLLHATLPIIIFHSATFMSRCHINEKHNTPINLKYKEKEVIN